MPQMSKILKEHAIGMLTAGMSTRSVALECSFLYHKPSPKGFQRIWQNIQLASQPQTTCNHTRPGPPHPASSPEISHPESCCNNRFALPKNFCTNCLGEAHLHARRGLELTALYRADGRRQTARGVNRMVCHDSIRYRFSYPAIRYLPISQKMIRYDSIWYRSISINI